MDRATFSPGAIASIAAIVARKRNALGRWRLMGGTDSPEHQRDMVLLLTSARRAASFTPIPHASTAAPMAPASS